jgi:hypothetical protein
MYPFLAIFFIGIFLLAVRPLSTAYAGTQLSFEVEGVRQMRMQGQELKANLLLKVKNPTAQPLNIRHLNLKIFTPDQKELAHINTQNSNLPINAKKETVVTIPFKVAFTMAMADIVFPGIRAFFTKGFNTTAFMKEIPNTVRVKGKIDIDDLPVIPIDILVDVQKEILN